MSAKLSTSLHPDGGGGAFLLTGERGIGKSVCIRAVHALARDSGLKTVETAGVAAESALSFASLQRLLRPLLRHVDQLPPAQQVGLLTAIGMQDGPSPDRLVVALAALGLIVAASHDCPLLITVDDIDLLDSATLEVISFVARRLSGRQTIVVTAATSRDFPEFAEAFRELPLRRLDLDESRALLEEEAPHLDERQIEWVQRNSAGNPLALVELASIAGSAEGVPTMRPFGSVCPLTPPLERAFGEKLFGLPQPDLDMLLIAAIDTQSTLQEIVAATSLLRGEPVELSVFDGPRAIGLLTADESRVCFSHPLIRSAIVARESMSRVQQAHRALGSEVVMNAGRRAWHQADATVGHDDQVAESLHALADDLMRQNNSQGAVEAFKRAAQLSTSAHDRSRRFLKAATRAADMGLFSFAEDLLASAEGNDVSHFDRVRISLLRDRWNDHVDDNARVIRLCAQVRLAANENEESLALQLALAAARSRYDMYPNSSARSELSRLSDYLKSKEPQPLVFCALALLDPIEHGGAVRDGFSRFDSETVDDAVSLYLLGIAAKAVGEYETGLVYLKAAERLARASDLDGILTRVLLVGVDLRLELGDWNGAAAAIEEVESLSANDSRRCVRHWELLAVAGKSAALRGDVTVALSHVTEVEHSPTLRRGNPALATAQIARGIAFLSSGRPLDAHAALSRVFDPASASHHFREQLNALSYFAEASVRAGKPDDLRDVIDKLDTSLASVAPHIFSQLQYANAALAADDEAESPFLECLSSDLAEGSWVRARAQLAYGRWLRRQRRVLQARMPLAAAHATFREIGATRWETEALDELEAAGHPTADPASPLSVQELKIARLAASGLSNVEIGQQLSLSPRTVASHLYRIFPKLSVTGRAQLAEVLAHTG